MNARSTMSAAALLATLAVAAPLFAAPPNDLHTAAQTVTLGNAYSGTTVAATNSGNTAAACGLATTSPDVWYRFDCTASTGVNVTNCGAGSYDSVLEAYTVGAGGALGTQLTCNDDSCGTQSTITFGATAGQSYYIRVAGYSGATGTFTITVSATTPPPPPPTRSNGPDVTIGDLADIATYGTGSAWLANSAGASSTAGMRSYAIGTNSWNIGDVPVEWQSSNQLHPVIGQEMYRYKDGKFEQIGISWLKHGFASTNSSDFGDMGACSSPPSGGAELGVNCADLYGQSLNGSRSYLGPRFDVNPTNGVFTYPWTGLVGTYSNTDTIARRLTVLDTDVAAASNPGAEYYVDCHYTTQDDAQWGNGRNNFSARKLSATNVQTAPAFSGSTVRRTTGLELWASEKIAAGDTAISMSDLLFTERSMSVTDKWRHWTSANPTTAVLTPSSLWTTFTSNIQGRFIVGARTADNGNGTWNYEYMVMNINSQRAGGAFSVHLPANANVSNIGFHAPLYHSGERILNNNWLSNAGAGGLMKWSVDPTTRSYTVPGMANPVTFNPNALMWGTMYNFRFTAAAAPTSGVARIDLFRAPTDATGFQGTTLAVENVRVPTTCTADMGQQGGVAGPDGLLDNNDFIVFIDAFFNNNLSTADIGKQGGVAGPDNLLDNNDFIVFIDAFFTGC